MTKSIMLSALVLGIVLFGNPLFGGDAGLKALVEGCGDANGDGILNIADPIHLIGFLFSGGPPPRCSVDVGASESTCSGIARSALVACRHEVQADYALKVARCESLESADDVEECKTEARSEFEEEAELCGEIFDFRVEICSELGEVPYSVTIDPDKFVEGVDNPLFPLVPGTMWVYEQETDEGLETTIVSVLFDTKEIAGVECAVVRDVVKLDGELVEDTLDWYAQDVEGNVWYFGEISFNYEDGEISDLAGSWQSGVDNAQPGYIMFATPEPGVLYRQEYLLAEAEDLARVVGLDESISTPYGDFTGCLKTEEINTNEPDVLEFKYYAPGVGFVRAVDEDEEGETLVDVLHFDGPEELEEAMRG